MIACAAWVGTFCTTRPLSNLRKITLTEQIFPFCLIFFTICAEKVCYKLCNTCYKLSNTCYKLCNACYKVCNKNFLKERKKYQAERKKYLGESKKYKGAKKSVRAGRGPTRTLCCQNKSNKFAACYSLPSAPHIIFSRSVSK